MGWLDRLLGRGNTKADGTIQYRDEHGHLREKRVDPNALSRILDQAVDQGQARQVYRILVKNVLSPAVEEHFMELTPQQIDRFVNPKTGTAYGCHFFKDGEPKFVLSDKNSWDKIEGFHMPDNLR